MRLCCYIVHCMTESIVYLDITYSTYEVGSAQAVTEKVDNMYLSFVSISGEGVIDGDKL